jgi:molybdopterin-guanine dinucleotide biosynthesis adapter protein
MQNTYPPLVGFAAYSGSGKTTLLTQLIPLLKTKGLRIAVIKHSHHLFDIDQPGKDSYRFRSAGANTVLLASKKRRAIMTELTVENEPRLTEQLEHLNPTQIDLILVEGFKADVFPKIEVHRPDHGKPLLYPNDPSIIAVASDSSLTLPGHLRLLDLNNPPIIANFILDSIMNTPL